MMRGVGGEWVEQTVGWECGEADADAENTDTDADDC